MKHIVSTLLLVILVALCGCNLDKEKKELTEVELSTDHVVMGAMCRYGYSDEIYGLTDVLLVYADGRVCIGTCPMEVGSVYSEFLGKVRGSDISVWSVLEGVEEVACLSKDEMASLIKYTQSIDLDSEYIRNMIEEPQEKPAVEGIDNAYSYFCYQWDIDLTSTYFPVKWSNGKTMDENALLALEFLLQHESYQEWYDNCQQKTWDATQVWNE